MRQWVSGRSRPLVEWEPLMQLRGWMMRVLDVVHAEGKGTSMEKY